MYISLQNNTWLDYIVQMVCAFGVTLSYFLSSETVIGKYTAC